MEEVYLDNNATTFMSVETMQAMIHWSTSGNPSAGYAAAKEARLMMNQLREFIGKTCGIRTCCVEKRDESSPTSPASSSQTSSQTSSRSQKSSLVGRASEPRDDEYKVIFNSGASESNCTIIMSVIDAYAENVARIPHVIASAIEHKSILSMLESLKARNRITYDLVAPRSSGIIHPDDVEAVLSKAKNTCLLCVMHANNETGAINDIAKIGAISHSYGVPFHCDTVQCFGKYPIQPIKMNVDSFCISFHKIYGPQGVGALIIKQKLLYGFKLAPIIFGTQNDGFRGGTENLPGIGAGLNAIRETFTLRNSKNQHLQSMKKMILDGLSTRYHIRSYVDYLNTSNPASGAKEKPIELILLSPQTNCLPNTILISVVKKTKPLFCNVKFRELLEERGVILSIGSACNTSNSKASHVIDAMGADEYIKRGVFRISVGDTTTPKHIEKFIRVFVDAMSKI